VIRFVKGLVTLNCGAYTRERACDKVAEIDRYCGQI
jgi:hypothetical protein